MTVILDVAGEKLDLTPISFREVQEGDTVAHLAEYEDGRLQVWVGTAEEQGISEWWGNGRRYSTLDPNTNNGEWTDWVYDNRDEVRIAATFHDGHNNSDYDPVNHTLFRVS